MNVYDHRDSALTLPGRGSCGTKSLNSLCAKRAVSGVYAPLWSSLPRSDPWFSLPSRQILEKPTLNSPSMSTLISIFSSDCSHDCINRDTILCAPQGTYGKGTGISAELVGANNRTTVLQVGQFDVSQPIR